MKLSMPKPTREMLPAIVPAMTATKPSRVFHAIGNIPVAFRAEQWLCGSSHLLSQRKHIKPHRIAQEKPLPACVQM